MSRTKRPVCHSHTPPSLPPLNQPWAQETKPFDGEEQGAMVARLIDRVRIEICIEIIDNEGLNALWPTQMPFSWIPESLEVSLLLKIQLVKEERRRFSFSATIEPLISYGLEYMLMMCLWTQTSTHTVFLSEKQITWALWRHYFETEMGGKKAQTGHLNLVSSQPGCFIHAVMGVMWHLKHLVTLIITPLFGDGWEGLAASHSVDSVNV